MAIGTYYHARPTGAGAKNGLTWATAFDEPALETFLEGTVVAGDVIFVESGTYTLDSAINWSARDGTAVSPIAIIGVTTAARLAGREGANILYTDWAQGADRPFFDCVTFQIQGSDYNVARNLSLQGSVNAVLVVGTIGVIENCKIENDSAASSANYSVGVGVYTRFINNEILSANARGLNAGTNTQIHYCYFHDIPDAANGIAVNLASEVTASFNVFDNVTIAFNLVAFNYLNGHNNTFYGCGTVVAGTTGFGCGFINNLLEGCTVDGFKWTTQTDINFFWKNHGNDARNVDMWDLVDETTVYKDYAVVTGDPLFVTPGSDHSLQAGSPDLDTGMSITLGV